MKTKNWSQNWKKSKSKNKKIKYSINAPLHMKGKFLHSHVSKELRLKLKRRSLRVRKGDLVKVMRGSHKGKEGKILRVNTKKMKVYIEKIERTKKDGSTVLIPIHPSKILIKEISQDKKRI